MQIGQRRADTYVFASIQTGRERQLYTGNVRLRIHQEQRHVQAMIEPARIVKFGANTVCLQARVNRFGKRGRAGCRVLDGVGLRRKAKIIVDQGRTGAMRNAYDRRFPVRAHNEYRRRSFYLRRDAPKLLKHLAMARITKHWQRPAAMGQVQCGEFCRNLLYQLTLRRA